MRLPPLVAEPRSESYDVVIVGGAIVGSAIAWFLSNHTNFDGSVLVVEKDPSYENSSTGRTNSCMRQQFSNELNIEISQYAAAFVRDFQHLLGADDVPAIHTQHFGYMYLADTQHFADRLTDNQKTQAAFGAGTQILSPAQIAQAYPFYNVDDLVCGSHNLVDEGYFDGGTLFDWVRRMARRNGVEYITNEVTELNRIDDTVTGIALASGETVSCGSVVNASGPRASETARMAGIELVIEPRRRYTFIFDAQDPLDRDLPLTIDPTGVHMRSDGGYYMAGCPPDDDPAVGYDDFSVDRDIWEDKIWPALVHRVPQFERIKVINSWAGHYSMNPLDQNAIVGPHPAVSNFFFANGFSGHGLQQAPAIARGVAEIVATGAYQTLDLSPLGYERIERNEPFAEAAII